MVRFLFKITHALCKKARKCYNDLVFIPFSIPQGTVLGLILFTIYLQSLTHIMKDHNLHYHQYADDTQLYNAFNANHLNLIIQTAEEFMEVQHD